MSKNLENENYNIFFKKLLKLINLLCQLADCGINECIKFPRICLVGTPSSGKSSVLESLLWLNFLPHGLGIVTRRPLEIKLRHTNYGEPWAVFEERKGIKFTDFVKVRETIEKLTDEVCYGYHEIVDKPIILYIYSQLFPDLTLVDLPGIKHIPYGDAPKNKDLISRYMAIRYIEDPLNIILCVIEANSYFYTFDSLNLIKEIDAAESRTIGVITKIDIMDMGTDARKLLLNQENPLKLGYVGVKNRSKQDLINKMTITESLRKEKEFFKMHPKYKDLPSGYLTTESLIIKLMKIYFKSIKDNLQRIIKKLNDKIKKTQEELLTFESPISIFSDKEDVVGKKEELNDMIKRMKNAQKEILGDSYFMEAITDNEISSTSNK